MLNLIWPRFFRTAAPELGCNADPIRSTDWHDAEIKRLKDELGEADEEIVFKAGTIEGQRLEIESLRKQLAERHSDADYQAVRCRVESLRESCRDFDRITGELAIVRGDISIVRQRVAKLRDDISRAFRDFESVSPPEPPAPVVAVENFDPNSLPDDVLKVGDWAACDSTGEVRKFNRKPYFTSQEPLLWRQDGFGGSRLTTHRHLFPTDITDFSKACWQKTKSATAVHSPVAFQVGDTVEVVDATHTDRLSGGDVHVINRVRHDGSIEIGDGSFGFLATRFKLISRAK